jgi:hypothetical protein
LLQQRYLTDDLKVDCVGNTANAPDVLHFGPSAQLRVGSALHGNVRVYSERTLCNSKSTGDQSKKLLRSYNSNLGGEVCMLCTYSFEIKIKNYLIKKKAYRAHSEA